MKLSKRAAGVSMASIRRKKDMGQPKTWVRQNPITVLLGAAPSLPQDEAPRMPK